MVLVDLLAFLRTGWFGPLRAGVTRAQIRAALGDPEAWLSEPVEDAGVWAYGAVEFHFGGDPPDRAWMIFCDNFSREWPRRSHVLEVDTWILRDDLTLEAARAALNGHGIAFEEWTDARGPDARMLTVASGVQLHFHREAADEPFLFSAYEQSVYEPLNRTVISVS
jgi:hypothetical protein